jgi:hypothetical protein
VKRRGTLAAIVVGFAALALANEPSIAQSCHWRGTAPFCAGECGPNEEASTPPPGSSSGAGCWTGSKAYCCPIGTTTGGPLIACRSGPGTCRSGYVWREASPTDHVCVTPKVRDQTSEDNAQAAARRSPTGGVYGPDTCQSGFVWREAFPGDHVCVKPPTRTQAAEDNRQAGARRLCP